MVAGLIKKNLQRPRSSFAEMEVMHGKEITPYRYSRGAGKVRFIFGRVLLVLKQLYDGNHQLPMGALLIVYLEK